MIDEVMITLKSGSITLAAMSESKTIIMSFGLFESMIYRLLKDFFGFLLGWIKSSQILLKSLNLNLGPAWMADVCAAKT